MTIKYLHSMVRVSNLEESLDFYCNKLGLREVRRHDNPAARYTNVMLAASENPEVELELTYNYDREEFNGGRYFGHLAYEVDDIYDFCQRLMDEGVTINRPPRDGCMAFVRSPDNVSIELIQRGEPLALKEPWISMANVGEW